MINLLKQGCDELNIPITDEGLNNFIKYMELLIDWNKKINLTAITDPEEIITKHFLDSITPVSAGLIEKNASVIDVGCGAGFPGLPIKLVRNDIKLTLLDSLAKRLNFINSVLKDTNTEDVTLVHSRAEDGGQNPGYREKFDVALSRAVANMSVLIEYCLPYVKVGGIFIALKGPSVGDELEESGNALSKLGGEIKEVIKVCVPFTNLSHNIVVIKKVKPCPKIYPRKAGTPSKKPL